MAKWLISAEHRAQSTEETEDLKFIIYSITLCAEPKALSFNAQMAKLVDALVSGTSVSNDVQVRVLFWAQKWRNA